MTIDDYLNQLRTLKHEVDAAGKRYDKLREKAYSQRSSSNFDGSPRGKWHINPKEDLIIECSDAFKEYEEAHQRYKDFYNQLYDNICSCLYLDGTLLATAYISNAKNDADVLDGLGLILGNYNRNAVKSRLDEAKEHLREILVQQGMDIE